METKAASRPRVLLLLTETYADGGIQRFNRTFLSACGLIDVDCDVLSLGDTEKSRSRWKEPSSVTIRVFNHDKVRYALAASVTLLRGDYDFVVIGHINLLELAAASIALRAMRHRRVILIAHGIEVWTGLGTRRRRVEMGLVDRVLSVSRYTRDRMRAQIPSLPVERFTIFPNALSEAWTEHLTLRLANGLRASLPERFILSVTRLDRGDRYKGIVAVIEALAMMADQSIHYVIAGSGDDSDFLRRVVKRFALTERVHFLGAVADAQLAEAYRKCACFVLPSGKEGFGLVFLEAMFFGAPVIAARAKGAVDVVRHQETGLLVDYGDTAALKATLERLLVDTDLRDQLRTGGYAVVTGDGEFTYRAYVARLAAILGVRAPASSTRAAESPAELADSRGVSGI